VLDRILRDVVASTPGAIGAIMVDQEGESVQFWAERVFEIGADGIRAIGAYQGIHLSDLKRACSRAEAGRPERFVTEFANARILTYDLKDGYFVVLITDRSANEGVAWHHLRSCRQRLLAEL
jgi:predicted regulator of Ras-like GTPase activity (Roadblock/LC7/MglB family)